MIEAIVKAYNEGGLQIAIICALGFVVVTLYRETGRLNALLLETGRNHNRKLIDLLLRLKTIKGDSLSFDSVPPKAKNVEAIDQHNESLFCEIERNASDIGRLWKGLDQ